MNIKDISSNSLSFIGDAVFTLYVRNYFVSNNYQSSKSLQALCNGYNSAKGQSKVFNRLNDENFFNDLTPKNLYQRIKEARNEQKSENN